MEYKKSIGVLLCGVILVALSCKENAEKSFSYKIDDYPYLSNDSLYTELQEKFENNYNGLKVARDTIEYLERIIEADILSLDSLKANLGFFDNEAAMVEDHYSKINFPESLGKCLMLIDEEFNSIDPSYDDRTLGVKPNKDSLILKDWVKMYFSKTPVDIQKGFLSSTIQEIKKAERNVLSHLLNGR